MENPTPEEIEQLDKLLLIAKDKKWYDSKNMGIFSLNKEEYNYLLSFFLKIHESNDFFRYQESETGTIKINHFYPFKLNKFIEEGGFKSYYSQKLEQEKKEKEYKENVIESVKSKHWIRKPEITIPSFLSLLALVVSSWIALYVAFKDKQPQQISETRIKEISDSLRLINMENFENQLLVSRRKTDSLEFLLNDLLDEIKSDILSKKKEAEPLIKN